MQDKSKGFRAVRMGRAHSLPKGNEENGPSLGGFTPSLTKHFATAPPNLFVRATRLPFLAAHVFPPSFFWPNLGVLSHGGSS